MKEQVLDHGFVILRNVSGPTRRPEADYDADDTDPANSARMSFDMTDSDRTREQDLSLADYLLRNWHTTPFEMVEIWLEMKLPIFVARQFVRHRTCTINEVSGRYVKLPDEWYIPEVVGGKPPNAKQGQVDSIDQATQDWFKGELHESCLRSYQIYSEAISEGIAAEHARLMLHLNHYTHWMWKQDLHNMMHFLRLRTDSHAQVEAQAYATVIESMLRKVLPHSMSLFDKYRRENK